MSKRPVSRNTGLQGIKLRLNARAVLAVARFQVLPMRQCCLKTVAAVLFKLLAELGSDKSKILEATIYLTDLANYDALNRAWDAWVPAGHAPARACVKADIANPNWLVEIKLTALA